MTNKDQHALSRCFNRPLHSKIEVTYSAISLNISAMASSVIDQIDQDYAEVLLLTIPLLTSTVSYDLTGALLENLSSPCAGPRHPQLGSCENAAMASGCVCGLSFGTENR